MKELIDRYTTAYRDEETGQYIDQVDTEGLVEAVVRECVDYAFSDDQERNMMLNHFGVEE
jgi:hypothetical protein